MQDQGFGGRAYAALVEMRERTGALLSDGTASAAPRLSLSARAVALVSTAVLLARTWLAARSRPGLQESAEWIVLYSSRTPKAEGETDRAFFDRVARSNRAGPLSGLLGIAGSDRMVAVEVRAGLNGAGNTSGVLDFILAQLSFLDLLRVLMSAASGPRHAGRRAAATCIDLLSGRLAQRRSAVVMLTSNSLLAEFLRLAACGAGTGQVEVLHGIASVGMEGYYDFLEANSAQPPVYVNLITGLRHFPSIERHMLRDAGGEVAVNSHIWSRIGPAATLRVPRSLADQRPLVLVGGTSAASDYYETGFFAAEVRLLEMARRNAPDLAIVYCPHPANAPTQHLKDALERHAVALASVATFEMLFCAGSVVGTYSTSLFEAQLLGKRVFLLPFDHTILMPDLLEGVDFARDQESLQADFARFLSSLPTGPDPDASERLQRAARLALGLNLEFEPT